MAPQSATRALELATTADENWPPYDTRKYTYRRSRY